MRLHESASWQHELLDGVPVKLQPEALNPPENTLLTFVAINHEDDIEPDYIPDLLRETDIFFPENNGWDPVTAKYMQKISKGDYNALQKARQTGAGTFVQFVNNQLRGMYNSRVYVRMADLPHTSPIPAALARTGYGDGGLREEAFPLMLERDRHIAKSICSEVTKARAENPKLGDKLIRATAVFGVGHMGVEAALKEAGRLHETDRFSSRLLFDSSSAAGTTGPDIIAYNNWLRIPE